MELPHMHGSMNAGENLPSALIASTTAWLAHRRLISDCTLPCCSCEPCRRTAARTTRCCLPYLLAPVLTHHPKTRASKRARS
eukprot:3227003-Prymnesium_polylepis.1